MPWCPVCKNEYKEGFTLCADCGAELVDFLEEDKKSSKIVVNHENPDDSLKEINEDFNDSIIDESETITEDTKNNNSKASSKPFVKAKDRAENYKSSAFSLLLVGIIGIVFLFLAYFKVIPGSNLVNISPLFYIAMGTLFIIFIIMGFKSLKDAKRIESSITVEEEMDNNIYTYFLENISKELIDSKAFTDTSIPLSNEEKFFPRSNAIKDIIIEKFGQLDEAYITELTENIYSKTFEA